MLRNLTVSLSLAATSLVMGAAPVAAAVVTRTFGITSATVADLYSATFDAALTPCGGSPTQECTFFGGTPPTPAIYAPTPGFNRHVKFTNVGTGSGFMTVDYEDTTGEIQLIRRMRINIPDVTVRIDSAGGAVADITVTQGNATPVADDFPFAESGMGTLLRDIDGILGSALGQGTADPDEGVAIGQAGIFQHDDQPNADAPDFAIFANIVDTCVDVPAASLCGLIPLLNLDGIKYRLEGTVSGAGGDALALKQQTGNNSILYINFTTVANPDLDGDGVTGADNCPSTSNADQADGDGDGRGDVCDNCSAFANNSGATSQCDANGDGYGNRCDGDLSDGGGNVNAQDYAIFRSGLGATPTVGTNAGEADINCNATVNAQDYAIFRSSLGSPPGPSGLACAGTPVCQQ